MKGKPQEKNCPVCGECLDIDTYVPGQAGKEPADVKAGDITFCFQCRTILVVNLALNIVMPEEKEMLEIARDPAFNNFINEIDLARKGKVNLN